MQPGFVIFGYSFASYTTCLFSAYIITVLGSLFIAKNRGLDVFHMFKFLVFGIFFMIIGAKIMFFLVDGINVYRQYLDSSDTSIRLPIYAMFGGWRFFGGVVAAILGGFIYLRSNKLDLVKYSASGFIFLPLSISIGRIGCFLAGCCYGIPYNGLFSITFPQIGSVHPLQLYESVLCLILFIVLLYMERKKFNDIHIILTLSIVISIIRFFAEYIRPDSIWFIPWLSVNQAFTILAIIFACVLCFFGTGIKKKLSKLLVFKEAENE